MKKIEQTTKGWGKGGGIDHEREGKGRGGGGKKRYRIQKHKTPFVIPSTDGNELFCFF